MFTAALLLSFALGANPVPDLTTAEIAQVDALFEAWDQPDSPGCALAIVKGGEVVYARGYGSANLEHEAPITADTVFRIASTSKQFAAACIHLLAQDDVLTLDDDVRAWIPELTCSKGPVSLRQLLHHTGGLRSYLTLMSLAGNADDGYYTEEEVLAMLARQRGVQFAPGDRYEYSNTGFFLLSIVVERASGMRMREYADEHLFKPLGMTRTHFHDDYREVVPGRAMGYSRDLDGFELSMTQLEMCGDGGLFTTVNDLTKWMANFRDPQVGGKEWLEALQKPGVLNSGEVLDYASGLVVAEWKESPQIFHGGAFVGFRAEMLHLPELGFGVVCLANVSEVQPTALCEGIRDLLLGAEPEEEAETDDDEEEQEENEAAPVLPAALKVWEGVWLEQGSDKPRVIHVKARRGSLLLRGSGAGQRFLPSSESAFFNRTYGSRIEFERRGDLRTQLRLLIPSEEKARLFERVEAFDPGLEELKSYAGDYWCDELAVSYRISLDEEGLVLKVRGMEEGGLKAVRPFRFQGPYQSTYWFKLGKQASPGIGGFWLDVAGVNGLWFERR